MMLIRTSPLEHFQLTPKTRVLVLGGYGVRNIGDEAILAGLLNQLAGIETIRVVSRNPKETAALHGVEAVSPSGAPAALLKTDALIIGGGGLFSSDTGPLGRFIPLFARLARWKGVPVALHGVGVYPSTPPKIMRSLTRLAPSLDSITVRDAISVETLEAAGISCVRISDLSESMPPASRAAALQLMASVGLDPQRPIVGLCLTAINDEVCAYLNEAVPRLMQAQRDVQFCFVPMSQHPTNPRHNDANPAHWRQMLAPNLRVVEGVHHPALILALFREFDAAICVRYHSYLFAERFGTPVIAVPYAEKCRSWLDERGLHAIDMNNDALIEAVNLAVGEGHRNNHNDTNGISHRVAA
jgi:polysaccharide pyruvyl transferase WcaK-like protein